MGGEDQQGGQEQNQFHVTLPIVRKDFPFSKSAKL